MIRSSWMLYSFRLNIEEPECAPLVLIVVVEVISQTVLYHFLTSKNCLFPSNFYCGSIPNHYRACVSYVVAKISQFFWPRVSLCGSKCVSAVAKVSLRLQKISNNYRAWVSFLVSVSHPIPWRLPSVGVDLLIVLGKRPTILESCLKVTSTN